MSFPVDFRDPSPTDLEICPRSLLLTHGLESETFEMAFDERDLVYYLLCDFPTGDVETDAM